MTPTDPISLNEENPIPLENTEEDTSPTISELLETIRNLQELLARAQADYANLVRRSREESAQIGQWTEDKTILKFFPILDNLERSLEHIPAELINNVWVE
jgi:molecular chaperone GrpE (heat shock protein)